MKDTHTHTPAGIGFLVLVPEGPGATLCDLLIPGSSSLILQVAPIAFKYISFVAAAAAAVFVVIFA